MITCVLRYVIDPSRLADFEQFARMWIALVGKYGGSHHGYFLPAEGANDIAIALFTFSSLARYEEYRQKSLDDPECVAALELAERSRCITRFERSFFRPVFA